MVSATDGSGFTGSVTVAVTVDAGTQATGSVGSGACTHEGNGYHTYAPAQAETNGDLLAFTFTGTGAVPVTIQVYTLPTTGILSPATLGRTLVVDAAGLADANAVKLGPTGSGTAQTARDVGASVIVGSIANNAITAASINADAITAAKIADGAIDAATFAAGAINAAAIAADAITDAKVAADVTIASVTGAVGSVTGAVGSVTGNVGGNVVGSVGSVAGAVGSVTGNVGGNVTGSVGSVVGAVGSISGVTFPSNFAALGINASGHVSRVTLTDTATDITTKTGYRLSATGVDDILEEAINGHTTPGTTGYVFNEIDTLFNPSTGTALDEVTGLIKANVIYANGVAYAIAITNPLAALITTVGVAGAGLTAADDAVIAAIAALNNLSSAGVSAAVITALTTALTEGYRATGATGSVRDLLYEAIAHMGEHVWSGTTKQLKKIDGSTNAKSYTINDANVPTSIGETT
jgi:hypothetical protein